LSIAHKALQRPAAVQHHIVPKRLPLTAAATFFIHHIIRCRSQRQGITMSSDNQTPGTAGADTPAQVTPTAGSPIKLLLIIAVVLAALVIFGALDR
jgi:hypothetical protein